MISLVAYGVYHGFSELAAKVDLLAGLLAGVMVAGLVILVAAIIREQRRDMKKMKEEIDQEDLKP